LAITSKRKDFSMSKIKNIPSPLDDLEFVKDWVKPRVSAKRFGHIAGVAQTGKKLAQKFSNDPDIAYMAELAGWLHDACKEIKDTILVQQAKKYGLKLHPIEETNGHLLHGPVAAQLVKHEFGLKHKEVLDAIAEHTLGAVNMSFLSKIVFLADAIEPSRPHDYADPIKQAIDQSLDQAILVACNSNLQILLELHKTIHPRTVEVRNYYLQICQRSQNET
jgi:predicted HD superfamily hydrolase involved in NAD metabolism